MSPSRKKRRLKRIRANRYGQSPNSQTHNPRYEHAALVGTGPRRGGHASDRVSEHHRLVRQRRDFMRPGVQLRCDSTKSLVGGTRATLGVLGIFALRPDRRARVAGYATHEKLARTVEPDAGGSGNQRLPDACRPMAIRSGMSLVFGVPGIDGGNFRDAHIQRPAQAPGIPWSNWWLNRGVVAIIAVGALHFYYDYDRLLARPADAQLTALAEHLSDTGARYYGAFWCSACQQQNALFGPAKDRLPYTECTPNGRHGAVAFECVRADIQSFPTWIINGERHMGVLEPRELARRSGFTWEE